VFPVSHDRDIREMNMPQIDANDPKRKTVSWRDVLKIHPAAELFPLIPREELPVLADDIKKYGLTSPIILWNSGSNEKEEGDFVLLDGRNRLDALEAAGIPVLNRRSDFISLIGLASNSLNEAPIKYVYANWVTGIKEEREVTPSVDPYAYVISANLHRRHLTAEQKRELIAKLIKADPEKSDRQIAGIVKASPTTVGAVRDKLEEAGDVSNLDTHRDTRGRKQPASKPKPPQEITLTADEYTVTPPPAVEPKPSPAPQPELPMAAVAARVAEGYVEIAERVANGSLGTKEAKKATSTLNAITKEILQPKPVEYKPALEITLSTIVAPPSTVPVTVVDSKGLPIPIEEIQEFMITVGTFLDGQDDSGHLRWTDKQALQMKRLQDWVIRVSALEEEARGQLRAADTEAAEPTASAGTPMLDRPKGLCKWITDLNDCACKIKAATKWVERHLTEFCTEDINPLLGITEDIENEIFALTTKLEEAKDPADDEEDDGLDIPACLRREAP
jgi:hypothetical protein